MILQFVFDCACVTGAKHVPHFIFLAFTKRAIGSDRLEAQTFDNVYE